MDFSQAIQAVALAFAQLLGETTSGGDDEEEIPHRPAVQRRLSLLDIQSLSPSGFEQWVADRFQERGFQVRRTGTHGTGGDHGVDLVVSKPGERAVVQCKNFRAWAVGEPTIRDLFGVIHAAGGDRAYVVITGRVTGPACRWAAGKPIEIWDHRAITQLLVAQTVVVEQRPRATVIEVGPTGAVAAPPQPPTVASSCLRCNAALVERRNRHNGERFLGCSSFPKCRFTQSFTAPVSSTVATLADAVVVVKSNRATFRPVPHRSRQETGALPCW